MADIHNTSLARDAQVNHAIALLGAEVRSGDLADLAVPAQSSFFSVDPEAGLSGTFTTARDGLVRITYTTERKPRWIALHLLAGGIDLSEATLLGIVCKTQAPEASTFRFCLRSGTSDGFVDAFLPKTVVAFSQSSAHVDLLRLDQSAEVPKTAAWRELILFFQPGSADILLQDLRVFIV